jgi:hypothetical protein
LLISNTLQWLDQRDVEVPLALVAGESLPLKPGQVVSLHALTAAPKSLPALQSAAVLEPLHNGYYLLGQGDERRWVAVNTFSTAESDLREKGAETTTVGAPAPQIIGVGPWPLWTWLTLGALALFTGEWWLFHRRKTE